MSQSHQQILSASTIRTTAAAYNNMYNIILTHTCIDIPNKIFRNIRDIVLLVIISYNKNRQEVKMNI